MTGIAASRSLQFGEPTAWLSSKGPGAAAAAAAPSGTDQVTNQLIAQLRQLTAADGARFTAKFGGVSRLQNQLHHQQQSIASPAKHQPKRQQLAWSALTAVPDTELPSFYRADSRTRCSCCRRSLGGRSRCQNADNAEKDAPEVAAGSAAVVGGGVGKKRRRLVQAKICDMFPNKKKVKLSCLGAPAGVKK